MDETTDVIDRHGFRANVGIVIHNQLGQVFWGRRVRGLDAWQFPQGGLRLGESAEQALYRELEEEAGLPADAVVVRGRTEGWMRYRLPRHLQQRRRSERRSERRTSSGRDCDAGGILGQKQKWFLLELTADDEAVSLSRHAEPEFDQWRWVSYWYPVGNVVPFKRPVYRRALRELASALRLPAGLCAAPWGDAARSPRGAKSRSDRRRGRRPHRSDGAILR